MTAENTAKMETSLTAFLTTAGFVHAVVEFLKLRILCNVTRCVSLWKMAWALYWFSVGRM